MSAYRTIVVGTDGSESSYRAVDRAAALAAALGAKLVIACAYYPVDAKDTGRAADVLREDAYQITGAAPTYDVLRTARERARAAGVGEVVERAVVGSPVDSLISLLADVDGDLLVVGNRGLDTLTGRLLGSVPSDIARKSPSDVLIVHTVP